MSRKWLKTLFSINIKEVYEVIVDLLINLNLLFNFSKQAGTAIASNFHKSYSTLHRFRLFATFNLLAISQKLQRQAVRLMLQSLCQ